MQNSFSNTESVKQQYCNDKNLAARYKLHEKHSTSKQGFTSWLWEQYHFCENSRILELGCGNANQWVNRTLLTGCDVILSDFSEGMVDIAKAKHEKHKNFSFQQIDIQSIPFADESFDIVIANHMLYHVPDLHKALLEVKRVLRPGGKFYTSTNGSNGMQMFLHEAFKRFDADTEAFSEQLSFTLQNGNALLGSISQM